MIPPSKPRRLRGLPALGLLALLCALLLAPPTPAQPTSSASPKAPATAAPTAASALPEGHPPVDEELPQGHPPVGEADMGAPGHGGPGGPGGQQVVPDYVRIVETLPKGTITLRIADADDKPLPNTPFELSILKSSVERGDVTERTEGVTDAEGRARYDGMAGGTGVSYTFTTRRGPAELKSQAFGMRDEGGIDVLLHVYDPVNSLDETPIVMEAFVIIQLKDDSFSIDHRIRTLNMGRTAFVPEGVGVRLPNEWFAFNEQEMDDGGVGMREKDGVAELYGTFPPGQSEFFYRYQLPFGSSDTQTIEVPLLPRVVHTTVLVGAGPNMGLEVAGFPPAQVTRGHNGQRVLQTVKQPDLRGGLQALLGNTQPGTLSITVRGIPTPGPWRWLALALASLTIAGGGFYLFESRGGGLTSALREQREDLFEAQGTLLDELALLEKARASGDVGPKSYERLRVALLDALARIMVRLDDTSGEDRARKRTVTSPSDHERDATKPQPADDAARRGRIGKVGAKKRRKKRKRAAPA